VEKEEKVLTPELSLVDDDSVEEIVEETNPVAEGAVEEPEEGEAVPKETEQTLYRTQQEFDAAFEKRLAREKRKFEREFIASAGVPIKTEEIGQAAKLWGYLSQNPQISKKVQEEMELRESLLEMRADDPTFKKYEQEILGWASEQGLDVRTTKDLNLAYMAWKGRDYRRAVANAELDAQRKMTKNIQTKKTAAVLPAKAVKTSPTLDYSKMTPQQILAAEGLKLTIDDE